MNKLKRLFRLFGFEVSRVKSKVVPVEKVKQKYHNSIIDGLVPEMVTIGKDFISAPNSIILAHDASTFKHCGKHRVEHTIIGDCVFLGAGAIILPGINVGDNVIIGAGSIVTRNIESNMVVAGNPAKVICTTSEYIEKCNYRNVLVDTPNCFRGDGIKVNKVCIEEFRNNVRKKQGF